jgi:hypothetical protein
MSSTSIIGPGNRVLPARQDQRRRLRLALAALAVPAFFVTGFALCSTSALGEPLPRRQINGSGGAAWWSCVAPVAVPDRERTHTTKRRSRHE